MMARCLVSNPPVPGADGCAGAAMTCAVRTGAGVWGAAGALVARPGAGATAVVAGLADVSAAGTAAGGRGTLWLAVAVPVLGNGAGRGSGTLSAHATPAKPVSAKPTPSASLAVRMYISPRQGVRPAPMP